MSIKNTTTTSDYIEWNKAMNLVRKLYADGEYRLSLLIGCGCFFGLRISDLLSLNWDMLLSNDSFEITEKKTKKHREIAVNRYFQNHIQDCYNALKIGNDKEPCFISQKKCVYSPQRINAMFKYKIRSIAVHI